MVVIIPTHAIFPSWDIMNSPVIISDMPIMHAYTDHSLVQPSSSINCLSPNATIQLFPDHWVKKEVTSSTNMCIVCCKESTKDSNDGGDGGSGDSKQDEKPLPQTLPPVINVIDVSATGMSRKTETAIGNNNSAGGNNLLAVAEPKVQNPY